MDCYRVVGENERAAALAKEVARSCVDGDGVVVKPMRLAEAKLTQAVVAARSGDLESAVTLGTQALEGDRQSLPSLLTATRELVTVLQERYPRDSTTGAYVEQVRGLSVPLAPALVVGRRPSGTPVTRAK